MISNAATRWAKGTILIIEDDAGDREIMRRALRDDAYQADLYMVADGEEAFEYLFRRGRYAEASAAPRPDLILLDLNLPGVDGKRILEVAKSDESMRATPIVVVTTSIRDRDVNDSYRLGCNSYVVKPLEVHAFIKVVHDLCHYWLSFVTLPREDHTPGHRERH